MRVHGDEPGHVVLRSRNPDAARHLVVEGTDPAVVEGKVSELVVAEGIAAAGPSLGQAAPGEGKERRHALRGMIPLRRSLEDVLLVWRDPVVLVRLIGQEDPLEAVPEEVRGGVLQALAQLVPGNVRQGRIRWRPPPRRSS